MTNTGIIEIIPTRKHGLAVAIEKSYKGTDAKKGEGVLIEGFASTRDLDRGGDVVEPAAFENSLGEFMANPVVTYMHDWSNPVGRVVQARIGDKGLWVKAFVSKTAERIVTLIEEGVLKGFSIGYEEVRQEMRNGVNHILELKLYEIAIVTIPMNPQTLFTMAKALNRGASAMELKALFRDEVKRIENDKYIEIIGDPEKELIEIACK